MRSFRLKLNATINGEVVCLDINPGDILMDVLRRAGYFSVKCGCGEGTCGACVVIVNGRAVNSCLLFAGKCEGAEIMTVEGLGRPGALHPIQKAMLDAGAVQCGFCTPGILMAAYNLLEKNSNPTDDEIKESLSGNLCRCTGYVKYIEAVRNAAAAMNGKG
jgi:aerobic-type carbon monoxide dehydrogenase small subunit (CoxS/CutS family)